MKSKKLPGILLGLIALALLSGCGTFREAQNEPQYTEYNFPANEAVKPLTRVQNQNNPKEVIDFARSLSKAGRYKEAAMIYLDAAHRFKSKNGLFEIDCRMSAVKEFWFAGDLASAHKELKALENEQDIYSYSSETTAIRKLRKLLYDTNNMKNEFKKAENVKS